MNDQPSRRTSSRTATAVITVVAAGVLAVAIEPLIRVGFTVSNWISEHTLFSRILAYALLISLVKGFRMALTPAVGSRHGRRHLLSYILFSFGMGGVYFLAHQSGHDCFRFDPNLTHAPSILDFLYFSIITVTTVGYGDILPAHTFVRLLVLFQVLFGLALLSKFGQRVLEGRQPDREP